MAPTVTQVAGDTYFVNGAATNWVLLTDGDDLTLIDAGYPGDFYDVVTSIHSIGFVPEQLVAVLITHAHVDHIGSLPKLLSKWSKPVYASSQEVQHAHREYLEQASRTDVVRRCWQPKVLSWALQVAKAGGMDDIRVAEAAAFPNRGALDLPGGPVPVMTPGHTSGHTCYYLAAVGAMVTGDVLVTGHAISRLKGPQLLDGMFHHDEVENRESLALLSGYSADIVMAGHGPLWRGPIDKAVAIANGQDRRIL